MLNLEFFVALLFLGSVVGFVAGLLGIGGGGIMVPVLTSFYLWQDFPSDQVVHIALGSSMASIVVTSMASARAHHYLGGVQWPVVKMMAPGIILGTFLATFFVSKLSALILALIFSVFMACVALQMFMGMKPKPHRELPGRLGMLSTGAGIGGVSAMVSIGGGTLSVPFLYWHNLKMAQAIGTSAALGVPIALSGTLGYLIHGWGQSAAPLALGYIHLPSVGCISVLSFITAPYGAKLHYRLPVKVIKKIFGLLLVALSFKMLLGVVGA